MKPPAKSVPPETEVSQTGLPSTEARARAASDSSRSPAASRSSRARAGATGRRRARLDAGLLAARVERGACAEEGRAGRGDEAPERRPVDLAPALPGRLLLGPGGAAVVDADRGAAEQRRHLRVPHDPAGRAVPVIAVAADDARAAVVVQRAELERLEHDSRRGRARSPSAGGRSARVDDPERVRERQRARRDRSTRRRPVQRSRGPRREASRRGRHRPRRRGRATGRHRETLGSSATTSRSSAVRSWRRRRSDSRRTPPGPVGSIWRKRSSTASGPMSAEHTDQIAPRLAQARKATAVCGTFGMNAATRSPGRRPSRRAQPRTRRPGGAAPARRSPACGLRAASPRRERRSPGGRRHATRRRGENLRGVVHCAPGNQTAPGIFSSTSTLVCGVARRCRSSPRSTARTPQVVARPAPEAVVAFVRGRVEVEAARLAQPARVAEDVRLGQRHRVLLQASDFARIAPSTSM
jgi:hypothetical protein